MEGENFAGNIIVSLASLPDFLRTPILKKRMGEFFGLPTDQKDEIIHNALEAGPTIPFSIFEKLFKSWLDILVTLPEEKRLELFSAYVREAAIHPQKLIRFNLDGLFEIFLKLDDPKRELIATTAKKSIMSLDDDASRVLYLIVPSVAIKALGLDTI